MSSSFAISDLVTRVTETAGVSESDLSSILLIISVVAMAGAALGVLVLSARAIFRRPRLSVPLSPSGRYRPTTILTAPVDPVVSPQVVADPLAAKETAADPAFGMPPVPLAFGPSPHESPTVPGVAVAEIARSSKPHVDGTEVMKPAFPLVSVTPQLDDEEPETRRSGKGLAAPIAVEPTLETSAWLEPPPRSEPGKGSNPLRAPLSSGLLAKAPAIRDLENFQYGARRA